MSFGIPVRNGLGVGLLASTSLSTRGGGFSPASLFTAGEQGFIYDPSDFTTLYQDPAGTTPVTAVGQTVGRVLDKSKGLVLGPELVANGDFSNGTTGWSAGAGAGSSISVTNGQLTGVSSSVSNICATQAITATVGRTYKITWDVVSVNAGTGSFIGFGGVATSIAAGTGARAAILTATSTGGLNVFGSGINSSVTIDNISVKELPGNHATQSVLASRPILAREPLGGRRNLLTWTEQFDNAVWTKSSATITANAATAPDGTLTADKLEATGIAPSVYQDATVTGTSAVLSAYMKKGSGADKANVLLLRNQSLGTNLVAVRVNLDSGAITYLAGSSGATATDAGNGWWRVVVTASITSGNIVRAGLLGGYSAVSGDFSYFWGAQLETGSTATPYQRVTSTYDVTEAGKADCYYLLFDGSDDFLATNTITPGTDKVQVFAGVRKLSDAARGALVDFGGGGNGFFNIEAPSNASNPDYTFRSTGTLAVNTSFANYPAPITNIVTGLGDISGDRATLRVNGAQVGQSTGDQGTGNYLAYPAYIGRRGGTLLPFNGRIYSLIVRFGANLTAAQIAQTEAWVNSRTGAY